MNRFLFRGAIAALILFVVGVIAPTVSADDVTWTLTDVAFSDGATASGSFVYDADTNTVSSVDITTTLGSLFDGATYTGVDPNYGPLSDEIVFVPDASSTDFTGTPALDFGFMTDLTDSGGVVPLQAGFEDTCANADCTSGSIVRTTISGEVVAPTAKTPEPASLSLLLLGIGILGLGGMKRKMLPA
jgi:PEP-CTERM motif